MTEVVRYRSHAEFLRKTQAAYRRGRREGVWISCQRTSGSTPARGAFEIVVVRKREVPAEARNGNVRAQAVRRSEAGDLEAVRELRRRVRDVAIELAKGGGATNRPEPSESLLIAEGNPDGGAS